MNLIERIRKARKKKCGSIAVMLTCIFVSVLMAVGSIGEAASRRAAVSVAECTFETAGRSILAGYDRALKDRYALFGYEYDEGEIAEMIADLSEETLEAFPLTECRLMEISIEKSGYCLSDTEVFQNQINEIMKYKIISDRISDGMSQFQSVKEAILLLSDKEKRKEELENAKEEEKRRRSEETPEDEQSETSIDFDTADHVHGMLKNLKNSLDEKSENGGAGRTEEESEAVLRNGKIKDVLPSVLAGYKENTAFSGILSSLEKLPQLTDLETLKSEIYSNEYILSFFYNHIDEKKQECFFSNEVEYILYGSFSDKENYKKARRAVYTIRTALNAAYLYSNPEKLEQTLAFAESLTPGPFVPLTQLLIITAWSALEASNDLKNLEAGNKIALIKSEQSWKMDLSEVISGVIDGAMIENNSSSGLSYASYLRLLLLTEKSETKLLRIMDLIQINLKGTDRQDFVLSNLFCGFSLKAELQKKSIYAGIGSGRTRVRMIHTY